MQPLNIKREAVREGHCHEEVLRSVEEQFATLRKKLLHFKNTYTSFQVYNAYPESHVIHRHVLLHESSIHFHWEESPKLHFHLILRCLNLIGPVKVVFQNMSCVHWVMYFGNFLNCHTSILCDILCGIEKDSSLIVKVSADILL